LPASATGQREGEDSQKDREDQVSSFLIFLIFLFISLHLVCRG
jgi:hypothetical protein